MYRRHHVTGVSIASNPRFILTRLRQTPRIPLQTSEFANANLRNAAGIDFEVAR
jgi:hypothetical protein